MYHATKSEHIGSIWRNGLRESQAKRPGGGDNMLGAGVYTTRQFKKCLNIGEYGNVVLKLAVYTGNLKCLSAGEYAPC